MVKVLSLAHLKGREVTAVSGMVMKWNELNRIKQNEMKKR